MATAGDADWHRYTPSEKEKYPLRPAFKRNDGKAPRGANGKRYEVALMDGNLAAGTWDGKTTRWTRTGWWHDVDQYREVK